ncbi:MAG: response regulator [Candidatus Sumerlaeota bacterium]|nr:response regulator [Candidatus Sumerlaeota bacterium]
MIEDEAPIRRFLRASLASQGYRIIEAETGAEGLALAGSHAPDLIILDLGLPDIDGLEALARLREWSAVPVIILTARGKEQDKIAGLDAGADDYLTKPFSVGELAARLRVLLRHAAQLRSPTPETVFETGDLRVDLEARRVALGGREISLTPIQFKLLATLVRHAGKVVTQKQLLKEVWGPAGGADQLHYVRIYIHQLRHKLEDDPARPRFLITEPWVGYRLHVQE